MIRFIADFNHLVTETDQPLVASLVDYINVYAHVLTAYETKEDLAIIVQLPVVEHWFKQMADRYPQGSFIFERIDARTRLQEIWGISIPDFIDPDDIINAGLLNLDSTPNPEDKFEDFVLEIFYDPLYAAREFPFSKLVELLDAFDEDKWKRNKDSSLIYRIFMNRIDSWRTKAKSHERKELISLLCNDPHTLRSDLVNYKVLQSYKNLGQKLFGEKIIFFDSLHLDLYKLSVDEKSILEITTQVVYLLNSFDKPVSTAEVISFISSVSGYLSSEYEIIHNFLLDKPELLSDAVIVALEEKFESLQACLGKKITLLKRLIQPEKPAAPEKEWDIDQMLSWATRNYLPYQTWCDSNNILDQSIYEMGDVFATWLYDNWHEIQANSKRMVFNILPNHANQFNQDGKINLILVIDNLGWMQVTNLQNLFQEHGFFLIHSEPYISMVPSMTEISKKCLLSGSTTYQGIDDKSYTSIIEKGWVPYFNKADFRYLSDPGKLDNLEVIDADTIVVNYHAIDKALHMSSAQLGLSHIKHIQNILKDFVETIVDFVKKHDLEEKIRIHIVTDHGSMRISERIPNDLSPDIFKGSDFPRVSHRFVEISNTRFVKLSDNLKTDCFFMPSTEFGNDMHFLCARRANRFLPTDDYNYVHGGLSPEEVIVPHLIFEAAVEPVKKLTVILAKNLFRFRLETIELEIGNPNKYAVEKIHISSLNSNLKMEPQEIEWLNSERNIKISLRGLFSQSPNPEEIKFISFSIRYQCHGEKYSQINQLPIEIKSMVELRETNIFDDLD